MIQNIVNDYQDYLKKSCSESLQKRFNNEFTRGNKEGAISEAVTFLWLKQLKLNPRVEEDSSIGGADFICTYKKNYDFIVEVTCLGVEALENKSLGKEIIKTPGERIKEGQHLMIKLPLSSIRNKVRDKDKNLSKYSLPTVLVITCLDKWAELLGLNEKNMKNYICEFRLNTHNDELEADFKDSLFFGVTKDFPNKLKYINTSVSAILFMPIKSNEFNSSIKPMGLLHPKPSHPLETQIFSDIQFTKVTNDVMKDYYIQIS